MIYCPRQSDIITIANKDYEMIGKPFDSYLKSKDDKAISNDYIAKWELTNNRLYLKDINLFNYKHLTGTLEPALGFIGEIKVMLNNSIKELVDDCLYEFIIHYYGDFLEYFQLKIYKVNVFRVEDSLFGDENRLKLDLIEDKTLSFITWEDEISEIISKIPLK